MLSYKGDLYAKVYRKYLKLDMTAADVDKLVEENEALKKESLYVNKVNMELSEHIPVWHDLRKNPADLPEDESDILCWLGNDLSEVCYCKQEKRRFYTIDGIEVTPLAWQHIELPNAGNDGTLSESGSN